MSKFFAAAIVTAAFLAGSATVAQEPAGNYKVGVVDRKKVYDDYNKQKDEIAKLEKEVESLNARFKAQDEELKKKRDQFDAKKATMSDEQRSQEQELLMGEMNKLAAEYKTADDGIQMRSRRVIAELREEINKAVREIGARENYHLIFDGDQITSSLLYFAQPMDITPKVIQLLNEQYGGPKVAPARATSNETSGAKGSKKDK